MQTERNTEFIHCFPMAGRCSAISQESRAPSGIAVTWEDKCPHSKCPLLLSPAFIAKHDVIRSGIPLWSVGSVVLVVSSPNFLCTPSLLTGGAEWETETTMTLCKHCSAVTKTFLRYQRCFRHKSKVWHTVSTYEEN